MSENLEIHNTNQDFIHSEHPMVVFLRGDEEYFNDFCMNAEQAMQVLGIRRSRLNQISGKELRVGRARIDNYIRPVYRKQDVEEYLKWIRPTATHKKSSDLLNEARSKLEQQSDRLSEQLTSRFESMIETFIANFQNQFLDQRKFTNTVLNVMQKSLRLSVHKLLHRSSFQETQSTRYWDELKEGFFQIQSMKKEIEELKVAMVQNTDITKYSERILVDMQTQNKDLLEKLDAIAKELDQIKNPVLPDPLPIVRLRRASGNYSRGRQESKNTPIISAFPAKNPGFVPSWRRKKVAIRHSCSKAEKGLK